jgi:hypothetical protein
MNLENLKSETRQVVLKGKYPDIFEQLEKVYELIQEQQDRIYYLENRNTELVMESGKRWTKLLKIKDVLQEGEL